MEDKKQLPLFVERDILPTGKFHISYSEIFNFIECSYRHKLKYVDKIDFDGPSIHTAFGHVVHGALEEYAVKGELPPIEKTIAEFKEKLGELLFTPKAVNSDAAKEFIDAMPDMLAQVPVFLDKTYPGWRVYSAEELLFEPIEGQINKHFKGFIDLVIKVPKKTKGKITSLSGLKGTSSPGKFKYILIDWKTTNWGWQAKQKRSFDKHLQLILYKIFWCQKHNIDLKDVNCGFGFIRRKAAKDGSRVSIMTVSVGPKAIERALLEMNTTINQIKSNRYLKNKMSCLWCRFKHTSYCP